MNDVIAENEKEINGFQTAVEKSKFIISKLPKNLAALMESLPVSIAAQLMLDRDPHGNVQVSLIETEKLLIEMVSKKLKELKKAGKYKGKFSKEEVKKIVSGLLLNDE